MTYLIHWEPWQQVLQAAIILPIGGGSSTSYEVSVSDDGENFRSIITYTPPEPRSIGDVPIAISFEATRARHWRIKPAARSKSPITG